MYVFYERRYNENVMTFKFGPPELDLRIYSSI